MKSVVILAATRTPLGAFQGGLAGVSAAHLGAVAIRGAVAQAGVEPAEITDALIGNVLQAGQGQAPARQAALAAGLSAAVRTVTINKLCGSGLQAIMQGSHALAMDEASLLVAGGMENMSSAPYLLPKARAGYRLGHQMAIDSLIHDGLWDPYNNLHMGGCAEKCAIKYRLTREQQDAYAVSSFQRANSAQKEGRFADEITPVEISDSKSGMSRLERDEGPARVRYDKISALSPAFDPAGTITAANASTLSDGAAALVLATEEATHARGWKALARLVSFGSCAHEPIWFTTAPVRAAERALQRAGWGAGDVDLWEVNEAFAVVPMVFMRELGVPLEKLNVRGGAISLGHPIGASGARIVVTLLSALRERNLQRGVAAICIGGGEGMAVCVEMI